MTATITDRTYLNKSVRSRMAWLAFLLAFAIGSGVFSYFSVTELNKQLTATYTSTTGEVIDEGNRRVLVGARRSRHYEDRRTVYLEYTINGTSSGDSVDSDDLQIGDTVTIWVNDDDGQARLDEPGAAGFWTWAWGIALPVITLLLLWGFVVGVRTSIRILRFRPEGREPDFVFALQNIEVQMSKGRFLKKRSLIFHGVMEQNVSARRIGDRATMIAIEKTMPQVPTYPQQLTGYYLKPGKEGSEPVIHAAELGAWWTMLLAFPGDLEPGTDHANKPPTAE
ncbi:DUF3592 domain-containing protein [Microbacterium sp.]|uniref:DUF3592 domain-containing protein n=1 Tax=Microbacterium sp. TaxID=51671 RepID=UPI002616FD0C|nr:DUF3592 domain-containing protein [Microbacterium sp.]